MKKRMYIRVSKTEQKTDRQHLIKDKYEPDVVYEEKVSSGKEKRTELDKMLADLEKGDVVIVESLSRLFRSTKHLILLMEDFEKRGVELISDKENVNTKTPHGKMMFGIFSVLSQFEKDLLQQRICEGLKVSTKKSGRPKTDNKIIETSIELYKSKKYSVREICERLKISRSTFYRELKRVEYNNEK